MHAEWDDIDRHHKTFRVQGKVRKQWQFAVKDKEQRDVPIPADLLQSLTAWHHTRPDTQLIVGNDENKPEGHLLRKLKTVVRNAGLNCGKCDGCQRKGNMAECELIQLHKFRRTYVTTCCAAVLIFPRCSTSLGIPISAQRFATCDRQQPRICTARSMKSSGKGACIFLLTPYNRI